MKFFTENHSIFQNKWTYHLLFWFLYTGFWHMIASPKPFAAMSSSFSLVYLICNAIPAYINIYFLMPNWLYKRKYFQFLVLFLLTIAFFSILLAFMILGVLNFFGETTSFQQFLQPQYVGSSVGSVLSCTIVVGGIKLIKRQIELERLQQQTEKAALSSELKFLKSQLNPHFMFNALNNIYFLIKKDPDTAAEALAKYSDILRYQIYDCNESQILLKQEIEFLENYINISKLRKNRLDLAIELPQNLNGEMIAPLILVPFVENAFKHVSDDKDQENKINIQLEVDNHHLKMNIKNTLKTVSEKAGEVLKAGGIGLGNVKRRLELVYPEQYELDCREENNHYLVTLQVPLRNRNHVNH